MDYGQKTSLVYIERDGRYLILHRTKKVGDENHDKWIGVGGKFEPGETPDECAFREVKEETGLSLTNFALRGLVIFVSDVWGMEYMYLYTATKWTGRLIDCDEGELVWLDKNELLKKNLWEGDRLFLKALDERNEFFIMKFRYEGERLAEVIDSRSLSPFRLRVYMELLKVPRGETITYGELARRLGCGSPRAVGQALRHNPFAPEIPCHRVIAADGSLCGFGGSRSAKALKRKQKLLEEEKRDKLTPSDYSVDAVTAAKTLLGKWLCRRLDDGSVLKARIVETEAYCGGSDTACHAHCGKTERNAPMYEAGGIAYVYLCYGMHNLLNVVTGPKDYPEAVLIRGVEGHIGPGRVTKFLQIDRSLNCEPLITSKRLWIESDGTKPSRVKATPRIGIAYATKRDQNRKWRFVAK